MPTFLDGQQNLAALQVPGVYVDIIPPQPFINGVPTNIMGLVGVASWGPVNSPVPFSGPDSCSTIFGSPIVRTHDLATYVWASSQVGPAIGYMGVRVTDGTDLASAVTLQTNCITFTAKYTGSLGNKLRVSLANGTANGSYMAIVAFPGRPPEIFNNIGNGISSITTVAGTTYTSVPSASTTAAPAGVGNVDAVVNPTLSVYGTPTVVGAGAGYAANDLITLSNGVVIKVLTVSAGAIATIELNNAGLITGGAIPSNPVAQVSTTGSGTGATFTLTWGLGAPTIVNPGSGYTTAPTITLTGGGGTGGSYTAILAPWLNMANAINLGNITRGPSSYVTASAGVGSSAPTLTSYTLTGGTDGAAGVTDATLVGGDTIPRSGMYALRRTGIDGFTLCDLSTFSYLPSIDVFALSENCFAAHADVSGGSVANAIAVLNNNGLDDFPSWFGVGDYPTFYDSENKLSRLINPSAMMIGIAGNLSPEQSPLNKNLRAISSTQKSQASQTYSDAELTVAEMGRVELIVGPPTTPGGNYYTFICGRNTSSNTAGNGIEYTRMTFFLARSFQSKAAGSIVGRLQSIRPDDRTRADAKALIDGFLASLQDPAVGSLGNGLIDRFSTICDLSNNPPILQARGYLFLYAAVRYLNVVRYFVIKLAGGGNVEVTSQSTPPSVTQFI